MTALQKIKYLILAKAAEFGYVQKPTYPCDNIDELYDDLVNRDLHWDAKSEVRSCGISTGLESDYVRGYESQAVAMQMPDGSWVGWTYYYGGGRFSDHASIDWMENSYNVKCEEKEKVIIDRRFYI